MAMLGLASASSLTLPAAAEGLLVVGANVVILPSTYYDGDKEWSATTWVYNTGVDYSTTFQGGSSTSSDYFCLVSGTPEKDANGHQWYEAAYDTATVGFNQELNQPIKWEDHTAPFSSDATFNGRPSYQWTTNNIMADIYMRRFFTTDKLLSGDVYLACGHDDAPCKYYINGVKVFELSGKEVDHYDYTYDEVTGEKLDSTEVYKDGWNNAEYVKLTDEQKALIKINGEQNLLAVHVHQNWGGAFADCGLYTSVPGGIDMGYVTPWTGKVLFNSWGGYNTNGLHDWEKLYEAQADDKYTIHLEGRNDGDWQQQVYFKTPIDLSADKEYTLRLKMKASKPMGNVTIAVTELDDDQVIAGYESFTLDPTEEDGTSIEMVLDRHVDVKDLKIQFNLATQERGTDVTISEMSLMDEDDEKELWVGTSYFNYCYVTDTDTVPTVDPETGNEVYPVRQIKDPVIDGRVETKSWIDPDFDDSMWSEQEMPMGNAGYMPELKSIWPGHMGHLDYTGDGEDGHNTNYWVRRTFTLDKVNERLSYALNVCHDDNYQTYVNGHLLQEFTGWTDGKNPKQVHIPARYLREGKNVIATYIQQNWGGRFYDCGINVEEVNYDDCADELKAAIALGDTAKATLTKAMQAQLDSLVAAGRQELETNKDAAEVKEYAKNLTASINTILGYATDVDVLQQTIALCEKTKDNGYLGGTLAAVKVGIDTCVNNGQTNALLSDLRVARKRNAIERHTETFVGSQPVAYDGMSEDPDYPEGEYYIYNVGERLFLAGVERWGAHAGLAYASNAFRLIDIDGEGNPLEKGYRIETMRPNGEVGKNDFLNYGGFVDCETNEAWEFVPVEGKTNVFNIARAGGNAEDGYVLLGYRDGEENNFALSYNVVDTDMKTLGKESNQWMLISKAELDGMMAGATEDNPVAATHLIKNPGLDQRLSVNDWYLDAMGKGVNDAGETSAGLGVWGRGEDKPDFVIEAWNCTTGTVTQSIADPGVRKGWYALTAQIYYRDGSYENHAAKYVAGEPLAANAQLIAGGDIETVVTGNIPFVTDYANQAPGLGRLDATGTLRFPDDCGTAATDYFQNGFYWAQPVLFEVTDVDGGLGVMTIGFQKTDFVKGDWVVADNFRLTYYGEKKPTAIEGVSESVAPWQQNGTAIYNLQGQRLSRTQKGVNIINGKKVMVK